MRTVSDLFDAFGGPSAVARALRVGQSTASEMKRRGSIPAEHWVVLVHAANDAGLDGVTFERLAVIHAEAKGRLPEALPDCDASDRIVREAPLSVRCSDDAVLRPGVIGSQSR